ncbi:hypothetical protein VD0002_g10250 [Verticillium dahliae]|nr:hypothetical protein BJF96_g9888 [Verticillium dahliae]PNH49101.1 hypothetical protein VD0003_g8032 [Verticillium dahliae]PNH51338.1 hypothetical protein VD0002_g10250 [Verticillium dahliae]
MLDFEARRHLRHLLRIATFQIQGGDLPLTLKVTPRVVKQQKSGTSTTKLLIKYRWTYTPADQRVITVTDLKAIKLCTHVGFQHNVADALLDPTSITSRMKAALCTPHGSVQTSKLPIRSGFCRDCHLEYTVGQWIGDKRVLVVAWQDISPHDPALDSTNPTQTPDDGGHMPISGLFEESRQVFTPPAEAAKHSKTRLERIKDCLKKIV